MEIVLNVVIRVPCIQIKDWLKHSGTISHDLLFCNTLSLIVSASISKLWLIRRTFWMLCTNIYDSGQRCTAVKVVLVMESVADALVEKVKAKVAKLTVGPPEDDCDITPVVSESSSNYIEGLVKDAKEKGATFCQEYRREGNLIWPLLLDNVRPDMRIAWEEPFGPVLPVIRINSVEEGIHHCNASNFGLQVSISLIFWYWCSSTPWGAHTVCINYLSIHTHTHRFLKGDEPFSSFNIFEISESGLL